MAKVSAFGFTNTSDSAMSVVPTALGVVSNYARTEATATTAGFANKTAPLDADEILTYKSRGISQVNTDLTIQHPSKVKSGVMYSVQLESILTTTDTEDADFRVDEPIVAFLQIRHPKSGNITDAIITQMVKRLLGSLTKSDGTWRFSDLMRGAEQPVAD